MTPRLTPGALLKQYRVVSLLGRGGMGEVYAAEDTRLGRKVAIKLLPAAIGSDPDRLRRFTFEAKAASALNHPSILTIHDIDDFDGTPFLVSELIDGVTLRERVRSGSLTLRESLEIAGQVAGALAAAHAAGIVHRDVKPENIMMREDGLAKLLDFGLAKATFDDATGDSTSDTQTALHTTPGVVMGTTQYMSPEQARGLKVDARGDIFSLGVVLYELLAGKPPFVGATPTDVIVAIVHHGVAPIEGAPPELDRILQKALDKERDERYQTAKDFAVDLRRLRKQIEGIADPHVISTPGQGSATWRTPQTGSRIQTPPAAVAPRMGRRRWIVGGATIAVAAAIAGLLAMATGRFRFWTNRTPPPSWAAGGTVVVEKLAGLGDLSSVAISDDEKYLAYTTRTAGRTTMWLRQMATASAVKIAEPIDRSIGNLQFTPDGDRLFYSESSIDLTQHVLKSIPVFGGTPRNIFDGRPGRASFSPDGKRFVVVRGAEVTDTLMIFNADGTGGQSLGTRRYPSFFGSPAWSPSGDSIAVILGAIDSGGRPTFDIQILPVAGGSPRVVTRTGTPLRHVLGLSWPDDASLVVSGPTSASEAPPQIWSVRVSDGLVQPITRDTDEYQGFSVARRTGAIVALKSRRFGSVWVGPLDRPDAAKEIPSRLSEQDGAGGLSWVSNDLLAFTRVTDVPSIWISSTDGSGARRLTEGAMSTLPMASPDGKSVVFAKEARPGHDLPAIFVAPVAGGALRQLTQEASIPAALTPDGRNLLYFTVVAPRSQLKLMPLDGGPVRTVAEALEFDVSPISPDGNWIAVGSYEPPEFESRKALLPVSGGRPRPLALPSTATIDTWFPDGTALLVSREDGGVGNLWRWDIATAAMRQLTRFPKWRLSSARISPDGTRVAFFRGFTDREAVLLKRAPAR